MRQKTDNWVRDIQAWEVKKDCTECPETNELSHTTSTIIVEPFMERRKPNERVSPDASIKSEKGFGNDAKIEDKEASEKERKQPLKIEGKDGTFGVSKDELMTLGQLEEQKNLKKEIKSFMFEISMDVLDAYLKCQDFYIFMDVVNEQREYFLPLLIALIIGVIIVSFETFWRAGEIRDMRFILKHGYSLRWKKGERIAGTQSGTDPRVNRDMKDRLRRQQYITSFQAFFSDLPWILIGIFQGGTYVLSTVGILSVANGAFGFGMKFVNIIDLIKEGLKKKVPLFTICPAEIKIGSGCSYDKDSGKAIETAYMNAVAECGTGEDRYPSLLLVFMTANVDHEKALQKLNKITMGKVPYSGCTICRGAMMGSQCRQNDDMTVIAIWAIFDPEGLYKVGMADLSLASYGKDIREIVKEAVERTEAKCKKVALKDWDNPVIQGNASFVWINPPPGPEDVVISGVQDGICSTNIEVIGGSSADNEVS